MIISHEDSAPALEVAEPYRRTLKVLLSPALHPELKPIAAGLTILPPGGKSDDDQHVEGEMFYVISGTGRIRVKEEEQPLTPGTAVWVPPWTSHQLFNPGDNVVKILWVLSPPGRETAIIEKSHDGKNS
jgi:quercetin dioxygenase-like cupin family protein